MSTQMGKEWHKVIRVVIEVQVVREAQKSYLMLLGRQEGFGKEVTFDLRPEAGVGVLSGGQEKRGDLVMIEI